MTQRLSSAAAASLAGWVTAGAVVAAVLAAAGVPWPGGAAPRPWLVLVDRSDSMPAAVVADALVTLRSAAGAPTLETLEFAGRVAAPEPAGDAVPRLQPGASRPELALEAALARHARAALAGVVVVSDGHVTAGDTGRALADARAAGLPVHWLAVGRPPPPARLGAVLAPATASLGEALTLQVPVHGRVAQDLWLEATVHAPSGPPQRLRQAVEPAPAQEAAGAGDQARMVRLELLPTQAGVLRIDLALVGGQAPAPMHLRRDAVVLDVAAGAPILYAHAGAATLASSLRAGGWPLVQVAAERLDGQALALAGYRAVVLDDIAVGDASARWWNALERAVRDDGLGLLVLGGERAWGRGGYRGSTLEGLLPLQAEPPTLTPPLQLLLALDKSGSMGQGPAGGRFAQAQRAVLEALATLAPEDRAGVLVFDAVPRQLLALTPAAQARQALARAWPVSPGGGTRLAPALDAAIEEFAAAPRARRLLLVVTDGFVDEPPLGDLAGRLRSHGIEAWWIVVGQDADPRALARVTGGRVGRVLHAGEAAELPTRLREGLDRGRARVQTGVQAVRVLEAPPGMQLPIADWPALHAHALTRPAAGAELLLTSELGDPLLARRSSGLGRVLALATMPGPWAPAWPGWDRWPDFAAGALSWVSRNGGPMPARLESAATAASWVVSLEMPTPTPAAAAAPILQLREPDGGERSLAMQALAPGRWQARPQAPLQGLYALRVDTPWGLLRGWHVQRHAEGEAEQTTSPALAAWQAQGLLQRWRPGQPWPPADPQAAGQPASSRAWAGLALALALLALALRLGLPWPPHLGVSRPGRRR